MNYPGGKGVEGVYHTIINQIPKHQIYIEGFLGGGAILRHKRPAERSYGVEVNRATWSRWANIEWNGSFDQALGRDNYHNCDKFSRGSLTVYNTDFMRFAGNLHDILGKRSTFIYLDPPYAQDTRSGKGKIYDSEMSDWFSHEELLAYITTLGCNVMISGYEHPVYDSKLSGWRKLSFQGQTRGGRAVETIWMNYPEPTELHDYRYLGKDYREREQIKRQKQRWVAKLAGMDQQRRYALMSAIEEFRNDHSSPEITVSADIAKNGDAGSRKPLKPEIAFNYLVDNYFCEDDIEEALISIDPVEFLRKAAIKAMSCSSSDGVSWLTVPGSKVQITMGRSSYLTDLLKLAKRVLDKHAAGAPVEAGLNWPPKKADRPTPKTAVRTAKAEASV